MQPPVMMALGAFRFQIATAAYDRLQRSRSWRWEGQDRINRAPALQYVGEGTETIDLAGVIYPEFAGGLDQVEELAEAAGQGEPQMLVDGLGVVWGYYGVEQIDDTQTIFGPGGRPRKIEFSLKLKWYGEDAPWA